MQDAIRLPIDLRSLDPGKRLKFAQFAREPFRIFFPLAVLAGMIGVALWPLHLLGIIQWYPGQIHARLMANAFFGGFILGFLGTAMPRMLSAKPLSSFEAAILVVLYLGMVAGYAFGGPVPGDVITMALLLIFASIMAPRARRRKDLPPPGFVLVLFGILSAFFGTGLSVLFTRFEPDFFWLNLQRLLVFQGAILFPIMGVAPFILPRFFGMRSSHDFPEALVPNKDWMVKGALAFGAGTLIITSFLLEAAGRFHAAYALRSAVVLAYLLLELPWRSGPEATHSFGAFIRTAFAGIVGGFIAIAVVPQYRVGLLHITFMGGFALITFVVGTRVIFGHSGRIAALKKPSRWIWALPALLLLAMATRVSGDLWPAIMATHYIYGALLWILTVLFWAILVFPKLLAFDDSE